MANLESGLRIGLDVSCLLPEPLTGVGYYTISLFEALARTEPDLSLRLFASGTRGILGAVRRLEASAASLSMLPLPARLRPLLWTTFGQPRMDRFTGPVDVAHGAFHVLPPSRAPRVTTVFDLTGMRAADTQTSRTQWIHRRCLRHAARHADALIAISESCKADVVALLGVGEDRVHVVPGGVDLAAFEEPVDEEADAALRARLGIRMPYAIHLGTLEPRKNLPRLLGAWARLRAEGVALPQLVLAGARGWLSGPVFEAINRLKLRDHVAVTGYLDRADAVRLLRGARACVYPSLYEGFGLPVLEAMAAGVPVLTSNVSSLPEVAGDAAILVDPLSEAALAAGIAELLAEDPERRRAAGRARAERYTWENSAAALARVYGELA